MSGVTCARGLLTLGVLLALGGGCSGGGSGGGGTTSPTPSSAAIDTLTGSFQTAYLLPQPSDVTFTDKQGNQQTVFAYPGQVLVSFLPSTQAPQATQIITSLGGTILSQIPQVGYYLVSISPPTTEASFIAALFRNPSVQMATPHLVLKLNQLVNPPWNATSGSAMGPLQPYAIPGDIKGSVVIDSFSGGKVAADGVTPHGAAVAQADSQAGGNPYYKVDVNPLTVDTLVAAIQRTVQGSWISNPEKPILINVSLGNSRDTVDDWYGVQYWIANTLKQMPSRMRDQVLITLSLGNKLNATSDPPLDVSTGIHALQENGFGDVITNNLVYVGANDGPSYSYTAPGAGCDVVQKSGNLTLLSSGVAVADRGTSYAAPRMEAQIEKALTRNPRASVRQVANAVKCACGIDPNITDGNVDKCIFAFRFSQASYSVVKTDETATITVNRVVGFYDAVTVQYAVSNGTAISGADYNMPGVTVLTFGPGVTTQTFTVPILNNPSNTTSRVANLTLMDPSEPTLGALQTATLTITSDNSCPDPYPGVLQAPASEVQPEVEAVTSWPQSQEYIPLGGGFPVSVTATTVNGSATASGGKGSMTVSASANAPQLDYEGGNTQSYATVLFGETVLITAPGMTGSGSLVFNPNTPASAEVESCHANGVDEYAVNMGGWGSTSSGVIVRSMGDVMYGTIGEHQTCDERFDPSSAGSNLPAPYNLTTYPINFTYGVPFTMAIRVYAGAVAAVNGNRLGPTISLGSSVGISYNENSFQIVNQPPDTKITFCRAVP